MRLTDPAYYRDPANPLPLAKFRLVESSDPKAAHAEAVKLFAPHKLETVPGKGQFRALLHHLRLGSLACYFIRYRPEVIISSAPMKRFYLCLVPVAGACHVTQGLSAMRLVPGSFGVVNTTDPISLHWRADCAQLVIKIDRTAVESTVAAHLGRPLARPLEFSREAVAQADAEGFIRLVDFIYRDLDEDRSAVSSRLGETAAETLFFNTLLRQVPNNYAEALARPASRAAPYYVRRAEEFMRLHAANAVALQEVVAVSGVSARTLFKGFHDFRGTGPMAYLKAVRLDHARQDLAAAGNRRSVTSIAHAWGFAHLGHFARDYKARFGELPSATRRVARK
ncbi:MAG: AraC family transcriptional regulator [Alphaproteobacteria bacterium]